MTEEEMENDPAHLRGRIDALQATLNAIIGMLPIPALRSLGHQLKYDSDHVRKTRDADPAHIDWDMWERSHHPKDRPPPVTIHAAAFLDYAEYLAEEMSSRIDQKEQEDGYSVLAATPEAIDQDADWQRIMRENGQA